MAATGGWHPEGTWMSKKMAADHIKLKRAYEPPAPDERTGLCFRESEVKAYDDALKSCGWPPPLLRVGRPGLCYAVCVPGGGGSFRRRSPSFPMRPGLGY